MQSKDMRRALRRHHRERLKFARQSYWGRLPFGRDNPSAYESPWTAGALGVVTRTPCVCSCLGCGNSRRWLGERSIQERSFYQEALWAECSPR